MLKRKKRNAGITIEIALSIALSVVVLFLVLGLFSENLKVMMSKLGIKTNMFAAKRVSDAESWDLDRPTPEIINVQIAADNASLSSIHKQAQATIEELYQKSLPSGILTDPADRLALAEAMTKFAKSGKLPSAVTSSSEISSPTQLLENTKVNGTSYSDFARANDITLSLEGRNPSVYVDGYGNIPLSTQTSPYDFATYEEGCKTMSEIGQIFDEFGSGQ